MDKMIEANVAGLTRSEIAELAGAAMVEANRADVAADRASARERARVLAETLRIMRAVGWERWPED